MLPGFQYVLLTEYLLETMSPEEIDAVTAHELGHVRGRHLLVRLGVVLPLWAGLEALVAAGHGRAPWSLALIGLPTALFATQAALSINLERRADRAAQQELGGEHLAAALTRLGEVNHVPEQTSWFWNMTHAHPGLGQRIAALREQQPQSPAGRPRTSTTTS